MTSTITFKLVKETELPLEVENLCPDKLAGKSVEEIKELVAYEGKVGHKYGEIFEITGNTDPDPANIKVVVQNSSKKLRRIGEGMSAGEIEIHGDAGTHVGDSMTGGKIVVNGNVDNYCGCEMTGGEIIVKGDAGDYLGAAYRGNWRGMKGGKILVEGNAGFEIGAWLRGTKATRAKGEPLIHVKGNVGLHAGNHNHGGFIVIEGDAEGRAGSEMARGDIVILGKTDVLASFGKPTGEVDEVETLGIKGPFITYRGDLGIDGKGTLYVKK